MKPKYRSTLALNITNLLDKNIQKSAKDSTNVLFRGGGIYEYDLDQNFGSSMPKIVMKIRDNQKYDDDDKRISFIDEKLLTKISKSLEEGAINLLNKSDILHILDFLMK